MKQITRMTVAFGLLAGALMVCAEEVAIPAMPANPPNYWLTYHLFHPGPSGAMPADPNCAFYWKGRYHLHYIYDYKDQCAFAHVSSTDMVHWIWQPTTLTPEFTGHAMFSGTGFITKEGKPAIIYHGRGTGRNQISYALDDKLEHRREERYPNQAQGNQRQHAGAGSDYQKPDSERVRSGCPV